MSYLVVVMVGRESPRILVRTSSFKAADEIKDKLLDLYVKGRVVQLDVFVVEDPPHGPPHVSGPPRTDVRVPFPQRLKEEKT